MLSWFYRVRLEQAIKHSGLAKESVRVIRRGRFEPKKQCSVHSLEKQASFIRRHANIKLHHDNAGPHVLEKTKSFIKINKFN